MRFCKVQKLLRPLKTYNTKKTQPWAGKICSKEKKINNSKKLLQELKNKKINKMNKKNQNKKKK